jgi:hypothetical protein
VNIHKNARLTLVRRREMVLAVIERGLSRRAAGRLFGLSAGRVGVWVERYRAEGEAGLYDRSSRPHSSPTAITAEEAELMLALRQSGLLGEEIAARLKRAKSTVSKVLKAAKLSQQRQLDRDPEPRRYEHRRPGDLLHLDIKKLGKFKRPGHRVAGRRPGRHHKTPAGSTSTSPSTDHSRVAYVELLDQGEQGDATAGFLRRAVEHFEDVVYAYVESSQTTALATARGRSDELRRSCASSSAVRSPTRRRPTARRSASSRPFNESGPTSGPTTRLSIDDAHSRIGCGATMSRGLTRVWEPTAHQPTGGVSVNNLLRFHT